MNKGLLIETYPLPRVDDLFANLSGGKSFSKLDLSQAYFQLPLAEDIPTKVYLFIIGYPLGSPRLHPYFKGPWKHC